MLSKTNLFGRFIERSTKLYAGAGESISITALSTIYGSASVRRCSRRARRRAEEKRIGLVNSFRFPSADSSRDEASVIAEYNSRNGGKRARKINQLRRSMRRFQFALTFIISRPSQPQSREHYRMKKIIRALLCCAMKNGARKLRFIVVPFRGLSSYRTAAAATTTATTANEMNVNCHRAFNVLHQLPTAISA